MSSSAEVIISENKDLATESIKVEEKPKKKKKKNIVDQFLNLLSSVKFGVSLLTIMILASSLGTFIVQKGTNGFREYYQNLMPAEKQLYTFLGFLDVYHVWWFNGLLVILSLNIILTSIDYFPAAWRYIKKPVVKISPAFVKNQPWKEIMEVDKTSISVGKAQCVLETILRPKFARGIFRNLSSFRTRVTENSKDGSITIFAECSAWNRLTAYAVHVSLLTIFTGAFIGGQFGHKGVMRLAPGDVDNKFTTQSADTNLPDEQFQMPFQLLCTDIKQDLLNPLKPDLSPSNTLDWHTDVLIQEKGKEIPAHIHLNTPFDHRGYRFFQASFDNVGSAREVSVKLQPTTGSNLPLQDIKIGRSSVNVPGVGSLRLIEFYPDFTVNQGKADTASGEYNKPVAELEWISEAEKIPTQVWAFPSELVSSIANAPIGAKTLVGNYRLAMTDFEKVSRAHILQIQYDPGVQTVYIGCAMLIACLWLVFFFSHQRFWILLTPKDSEKYEVQIAGNTNRNRPGFEKKFLSLIDSLN